MLKAYGAKTNKLNRNSDLVSDNQSSTQESAAPQPSVDGGVVTQIKSRIAAEHPGDYYLQKILVDAEIKSWQELQHNYTDIPDSVFNEIRDRKAQEHPNQYHLQQILTDADVKAWKELKQ